MGIYAIGIDALLSPWRLFGQSIIGRRHATKSSSLAKESKTGLPPLLTTSSRSPG